MDSATKICVAKYCLDVVVLARQITFSLLCFLADC